MVQKYWVPALEKAHAVMRLIADKPQQLRLMDLSRLLGINKSSLYSMLHTMEALEWVVKTSADTYSLGEAAGQWGQAYLGKHDLISSFNREAVLTRDSLQETIQLARLEGPDVFYLAKLESPSIVKLASEPGMRFPAYVTALGKSMLAMLTNDEVEALHPEERLASFTEFTLRSKTELFTQLREVRERGFALDQQEVAIGFCCVAAAVADGSGRPAGAVSCSMPLHVWNRKQEAAQQKICQLAKRLSVMISGDGIEKTD